MTETICKYQVDPKQRTFTVPGKPKGKATIRVAGERAYLPKTTSDFQTTVGWCFKQAYPKHQPWTGPIRITIHAHFAPEKKDYPTTKPDYDNIAKIIGDGLTGVAYKDDAQIVEASIKKIYSAHAHTEVTIEELHQ